MASESEFASVPPWPSDVPTLELPRVSLQELRAHDPHEEAQLFNSCRQLGFFLLDLSNDDVGNKLMAEISEVLQITREFYAQTDDAKLAYAVNPPERLLGYKKLGYTTLSEGVRDRCEVFSLGQEELSNPRATIPPHIRDRSKVFNSYVQYAQTIIKTICRVLDVGFQLPEGSFWKKHCPDQESFTMFRLIRLPPCDAEEHKRASMVTHTDFGTITLLVNILGGLQVLEPGQKDVNENWKYIKPEPKCLIVNMGDAMVEWSGGVLRSNLHRVSYAPGDQSQHHRYSVAYLRRPAREADMKRLRGGLVPDSEDGEDCQDLAYAWEHKKTLSIIQNHNLVGSAGGRLMKGETK
jgi:isopenicillin N synthase-like dioxygenase